MASFQVRLVCETETGDGNGWHYHRTTQVTVDESIPCPDHPESTVRDFVIEETSVQ